ncbi:MAG: DUF362 domain-containing protein [Candidatus Zixiibacteriota bacterium]|nr:MAG: DUF362 domain-containing protein [candidate division Zixibacteria bacterium]
MNNNQTRRQFIKKCSQATASIMLFGACVKGEELSTAEPEVIIKNPRQPLPNPYVTDDGRPILVCVEGEDFNQTLSAGLDALGGLNRLVNSNQNVLIKPNCNYADPYPGISSANSVAEIISAVKQVSSGTVYVGDQGWMHSDEVYEYMGLSNGVEAADGVLLTFSDENACRAKNPDWTDIQGYFWVYSEVYDAPAIISLCSLKRHFLAKMTCALKNNVGAIRGSGMTSSRAVLHDKPQDEFLTTVAEFAGLINPELNIVDARSILTRNGPLYQQGTVVTANKLIICGDMVATDAYCSQIMEQYDSTFSPSMIDLTLERAQSRGLGTSDLSNVEIIEISI